MVFLPPCTNSSGLSRKNLVPFRTLSLSAPSLYLLHWVSYPILEDFSRPVVGGSAWLLVIYSPIHELRRSVWIFVYFSYILLLLVA